MRASRNLTPSRRPVHQTEADVKASVLTKLRRDGLAGNGCAIVSEFVMGRSGTRADLAIVSNRLIAVEIKTAQDSLKRLDAQLKTYRRFSHLTILVLAEKHLPAQHLGGADEAEIWKIGFDGTLSVVREGRQRHVAAECLLELLTQAELRQLGARRTPDDAITSGDILGAIGQRFRATSEAFWEAISGRRISPEHLSLLSRFRPMREEAEQYRVWQEERWKAWDAQADEFFAAIHERQKVPA